MRRAHLAWFVLVGALAFSCAKGTNLDTASEGSTGDETGSSAHGSGGPSSSSADATGSSVSSGNGASSSGSGSASGGVGGGGPGSGAGGAMSGAGGAINGGAGGALSGGPGAGGGGPGSGAGGALSGGSGAGGGGPVSCVALSQTFASCPSGFTTSGTNNDWQCGVPSGNAGPPGDHTGNGSLWGTNISGNANNCEDAELTSPTIDLSTYAGKTVHLSFWHWFDFRDCTVNGILCPQFACQLDTSSYSGGAVEVFANGSWTQVNPIGGYANGGQVISCKADDAACTVCSLDGKTGFTAAGNENVWQQSVIDLSPYVSAMSKIRFRFASHDAYSCYPKVGGWYIDDIEITADPCP